MEKTEINPNNPSSNQDDATVALNPSATQLEGDEPTMTPNSPTLARPESEALQATQALVHTVVLQDDTEARSDPDATPTRSDRTDRTQQTVLANTQTLAKETERRLAQTAINPDALSEQQKQRYLHAQQNVAKKYPGKRVLKDRFVLMKTLGTGGMGNVYLAVDLLREEMEDSNPYIAVKELNEACRRMPGALQSLQREAKKAQTLSHPNIVTVYDFDRDGERAFITMEYIKGHELKDYLRKHRSMPYDKVYYVIERVARGLAYAHQEGFAHSDIKPANIFLAEDGAVKILDFGIAKAFGEARKEKRTAADDLTEGALTPAYASLEMLQGEMALPGDDVYSLCCMAYEMLAGHHPFVGADGLPMPANIAKAKQAKVAPIAKVPGRYMKALRKGLEFERSKRFANADEFLEATKPLKLKATLAFAGAVALISGLVYFGVNQGLEQVVPAVSSLKPELAEFGSAVTEADALFEGGDIDMAHRLYAQAWELGNNITADDVAERKKTTAIIVDRMTQISDVLIERSEQKNLDEYGLRELYVALEFMQKDEIAGNEKRIDQALTSLRARIDAKK